MQWGGQQAAQHGAAQFFLGGFALRAFTVNANQATVQWNQKGEAQPERKAEAMPTSSEPDRA